MRNQPVTSVLKGATYFAWRLISFALRRFILGPWVPRCKTSVKREPKLTARAIPFDKPRGTFSGSAAIRMNEFLDLPKAPISRRTAHLGLGCAAIEVQKNTSAACSERKDSRESWSLLTCFLSYTSVICHGQRCPRVTPRQTKSHGPGFRRLQDSHPKTAPAKFQAQLTAPKARGFSIPRGGTDCRARVKWKAIKVSNRGLRGVSLQLCY